MKKEEGTPVAHFVEFFCEGSFYAVIFARKIETREISKISLPEGAFAFRFFDLELSKKTIERIKKGDIPIGRRFNFSPKYFCGGKIYELKDLKKGILGPKKTEIARRLIGYGNKYKVKKFIRCRTGNWQPFKKDDEILEI